MEKWCVRPLNKEEAFIVGKWFDENYGCSDDKTFYQFQRSTGIYYIYGRTPGNVYSSYSEGTQLTFDEFLIQTKIINNTEPNYEIY